MIWVINPHFSHSSPSFPSTFCPNQSPWVQRLAPTSISGVTVIASILCSLTITFSFLHFIMYQDVFGPYGMWVCVYVCVCVCMCTHLSIQQVCVCVCFRCFRRGSPSLPPKPTASASSAWSRWTKWWTRWSTAATRMQPPSPSGRMAWTSHGPTSWSLWRRAGRCWPHPNSCTSSSPTAKR